MRARVSVCMIVRDEVASGIFEECIASIRPHVEEIVVVDTGSTDSTAEIARRYADVFEVYTECNDPSTGLIKDFSAARQRSFALARQPWIMWMDSDDRIAGGEHLAKLIEIGERNKGENDWCYVFPYEYAYDPAGRCVCLHYRERLLSRKEAMRWTNRVHEVLIPAEGAKLTLVPCDDVVFQHQRQRSLKPVDGGRNLRILKEMVEVEGADDARHFYYLGLEYANSGQLDKAVEWLSKYVGVSGWDDEKTMAALKLAEIAYSQGDLDGGIRWAFKAIETHESWGEGYFALARGFYGLAMKGEGNPRRNWERCVYFARAGLALPPTKTMLFVNPLERDHNIHVYLNMALNQIGEPRAALVSVETALRAVPDDANLKYNRRVFQAAIAREDLRAACAKLKEASAIDDETQRKIEALVDPNAPKSGEAPRSGEAWPDYSPPATYPKGVALEHFPIALKTPHARAWGIPEGVELNGLPVRMTPAQVEAATILLWKEYMLHDEVMAAERLLSDAPYRTKHSVAVQRALALTRGTTAWMDDAVASQKINAPADVTTESGVALPGPLSGQLLNRSDLAISRVRRGERIVDFGCFDGGIVNRWGMSGFDVVGVDLCATSIALARRKAEEFNTGVRYVQSYFRDVHEKSDKAGPLAGRFDVVTCCDTYEHVRDPVTDIIAPARTLLKPDGRMVLVTPHGAWMRGEFVEWAHPWVWSKEKNAPWNAPIERAHLVAPTVWSVAENFRRNGWWVKDSFVALSEPYDVPGQGNVVVEAHVADPRPRCESPLDVVFMCGDAWEAWNPETAKKTGIGGSETAVIEMARRLSLVGHRVRVYTSVGESGEGIFDGVEYYQTEKAAMLKEAPPCDVLIAWRNADFLAVPAKARLLWVHDIFALNAKHPQLLQADAILALSEWHRGFLAEHHKVSPSQIVRTRNGIDLARFERPVERNPRKVVYSSSPDRGLPVLLTLWPQIRSLVPDAELHVFYGFDNWRKMAEQSKNEQQIVAIDMMLSRMRDLEPQGVKYRGRVEQKELAREFLSAGVWAYPTWFSETSCITAMEAQAAGLRIVSSTIAALNETVADRGVLLPGDWLSPEYQSKFVDEVVRALTAPEGEWVRTRAELQAHARVAFSWDSLAAEWETMMRALVDRVHDDPLVPYYPRHDFVREAA